VDITAVIKVESFIKFHTNDIADAPLIKQLFDFSIMRRVTQSKPDIKKFFTFFPRVKHFFAIINICGEWFLTKDIFAGIKRRYCLFFVITIPRRNHHPINFRFRDERLI